MEILNKLTDALNSENTSEEICNLINNDNFETATDNSENIIIHKKGSVNGKKIMICFIAQSNGVVITNVNKGKAKFEKTSQCTDETLNDKEVFFNNESVGIIRSELKDDKISVQSIELWDENSIKTGDFCKIKSTTHCKANKLYGSYIDSIIPCKIVLCSANKIAEPVNDLYFTVCFSEKSAKDLAGRLNPDYVFVIYTAKTTEDFKISEGCGIVFKDGNAVTNKNLREFMTDMANECEIKFQPYIGKIMRLTEALGITGKGAHVGAICLPVNHMDSSCQVADISDITAAEKLLLNILNI